MRPHKAHKSKVRNVARSKSHLHYTWDWQVGLDAFFERLTSNMSSTIPMLPKGKDVTGRMVVTNLSQLGEQHIGTNFRIKGIYSEYTPILNPSLLFPRKGPLVPHSSRNLSYHTSLPGTPEFALPLRLNTMNGIGLGGLYEQSCSGVYDTFVPVFYGPRQSTSQRNLTGWLVELEATLVNIPESWKKLFIPKPSESFGHKALFLRKIKKIKKCPRFLIDLWRFDYFVFTDPDDESVNPFQEKVERVDWPGAAEILSAHLAFMSFQMLFKRQVSTFGILPMIDTTKKPAFGSARRHLKDYYRFASKQATKDNARWNSQFFSVGHGATELSKTKIPTCVFQYDQVDPVLRQEYKRSSRLTDQK